ncbi:hypothetical protein BCR41DRAFT_348346 [Lobosporangium transversale]|uniref:Uncharacterized protein n=1 Tax=Lobosporangium transversale TaxID=64571 RepID=A0A1Y2GYA0_9FUNG|nr:hypothetical protein BCR41DRAFT_348346 [Lobosporangium transversale]ORZ26453.1 hypothetical protein BCR41DRAFT_348346 [Lobosporangium transversale]|eukprot:XP_021884218.1 hypothetical protein BCR41DRAFT_348346 [Lobosporangium transversale]
MQGSLWLLKSKTFAYVDMLLAPKYLFQVTTDKDHDIESKPFKALLKTPQERSGIALLTRSHLFCCSARRRRGVQETNFQG